MKKNNILIWLIATMFVMTACDYLDIVPSEITTEDDIFKDIKVAEKALGRIYWLIYWDHNAGITRDGMRHETGSCTDEMKHHWESTNPYMGFNRGTITTTWDPLGEFTKLYQYIRQTTIFINKIDDVPLLASQEGLYAERKKQFKEEARWFRAYFYFDLLRQYGPVPIVTDLLDFTDIPSTRLPRNSVSEVVDYILSELATAEAGLPDFYPLSSTQNYGRITKSSCLALKSRVLLYAASPLLNGNSMYAKIVNPDGKQIFPQTYDKIKNCGKKLLMLPKNVSG